jgi:hypothetical protein
MSTDNGMLSLGMKHFGCIVPLQTSLHEDGLIGHPFFLPAIFIHDNFLISIVPSARFL